MFCSQCGSQQDDSARFCGSCGTAVSAAAAPAPPAQGAPAAPPASQLAHPAPAYGYAPPPATSGTAVAALVLAFFFPVVGLILGYVAKNEIRNSGGTRGGDGMATAAIALGWIFTAVAIIWIIVVAAGASSYYSY